jgi:hypothetical protein
VTAAVVPAPGTVFGRGTVLGPASNAANGSTRSRLRCECGTEYTAKNERLTAGRTRSCGCLFEQRFGRPRHAPSGDLPFLPVPEPADAAVDVADYDRPRTWADCQRGGCNAARPCPWVSCRWNLLLQVEGEHVMPDGTPREPDHVLPWQSCALDVAERGGATLQEVADLLGMSRERVRQIEERALDKLWAAMVAEGLNPASLMPAARQGASYCGSGGGGGRKPNARAMGPTAELDVEPCAENAAYAGRHEARLCELRGTLDRIDAALLGADRGE